MGKGRHRERTRTLTMKRTAAWRCQQWRLTAMRSRAWCAPVRERTVYAGATARGAGAFCWAPAHRIELASAGRAQTQTADAQAGGTAGSVQLRPPPSSQRRSPSVPLRRQTARYGGPDCARCHVAQSVLLRGQPHQPWRAAGLRQPPSQPSSAQSAAATAWMRVVSKVGTVTSAGPTSRPISVQPRMTPSAPAATSPAMISR